MSDGDTLQKQYTLGWCRAFATRHKRSLRKHSGRAGLLSVCPVITIEETRFIAFTQNAPNCVVILLDRTQNKRSQRASRQIARD